MIQLLLPRHVAKEVGKQDDMHSDRLPIQTHTWIPAAATIAACRPLPLPAAHAAVAFHNDARQDTRQYFFAAVANHPSLFSAVNIIVVAISTALRIASLNAAASPW